MKKFLFMLVFLGLALGLTACGDNNSQSSGKKSSAAQAEVITGQEDLISDLYYGKTTTDKLAITHLNKRFEFMGQITGRTTVGDATIVTIEDGRATCSFTDQQQRLAVSDIGRSCWLWTGTLRSVNGGVLDFQNCTFRRCQ